MVCKSVLRSRAFLLSALEGATRLVGVRLVDERTRLSMYHRYPGHVHACYCCPELPAMRPEMFAWYFKFACVRNPWDRCVSLYKERVGTPGVEVDFTTFVQWLEHASDTCLWPTTHRNQVDWLSIDGLIAVDCVMRFETLDADWRSIAARLNVSPDLPNLDGRGQPDSRGQPKRDFHENYRSYYTPETRDRVGRLFRRDIEAFSYEF